MVLLTRLTNPPQGLWRARRLPWLLSAVIIAVAVTGNGLTAWRVWTRGPDGFGSLEFELTLCVVDVLLWTTLAFTPSRTWVPILLLQALLVATATDPGSFTIEMLVLLGFLAYAAARHALLISVLGTLVWVVLLPRTPETALGTGFVGAYVALVVLALIIGLSLRTLVARREQDMSTIADFEDSTRTALQEQRDELARELHDIVAHDLTVIAMQASAGAMQTTGARERESLTVIADAARSALDDLRLLLRIMREPRSQETVDPPNAGIDLADQFAELAGHLEDLGHEVSTRVSGDLTSVPHTVRATIRRVLREGTTNILKHGPPRSRVTLETVVADGTIITTVTNTLEGSPAQARTGRFGRSGFGLIGLRERVQLLDGRLEAGPDGAGSYRLTVRLPFKPTA